MLYKNEIMTLELSILNVSIMLMLTFTSRSIFKIGLWFKCIDFLCAQSHKAPTIIIYDSRVVHDLKLPHITTLEL